MKSRTIKCIVACINSNGESDLYFVKVRATPGQINQGDHYDAAKAKCDAEGYDAVLAYDEDDRAGAAMLSLFEWECADEVVVSA